MKLALFGEWDNSFQILLLLMVFDYVSGVLTAFYKKEFRSNIGYKGIIKKVGMLLCIAVSSQIDTLHLYDGDICTRSIILLFFSINESLSIFENLNKIGVTIPDSILENVKKKIQK
ncbi:phage holin family protein [Velocimicrobium porci]|uniref:Phage holin family protein n=1 Tax=Velocimicrobium porci TaxID=2606634 RepID=A0A6L5XWF5_9FIRM|nr:phage holin family protein [Velocimicrobium porci]MSS62914.1 phage holin family protein [Velocimicrobium porci]